MRISSLSTANLKAFESFTMECSDVNIIAGQNAEGKTSVLAFITGLFGKGNSRMLRPGCDSGFIKAKFISDDGEETWDVERIFEPGKVRAATVESSKTGKLGGAKSEITAARFIEQIADSISIDPISRAMNASEADQVKILLETMPMKLEHGELEGAVAELGSTEVPGLAAHLSNATRLASGLDAIRATHKAIYDHRRDVNRDAKTKSTHAGELLAGIPEGQEDGIDWKENLDGVNAEIRQAEQQQAADRLQAEQEYAKFREVVVERERVDNQRIDADIDERIKELEAERTNRKAIVSQERTAERDDLSKLHQESIDEIVAKYKPDLDRLTAAQAVDQQRMTDQVRHNATRAIAVKNAKESDLLTQHSDKMTAVLAKLQELELTLLKRSKIKGLTMREGIIYLDNMPLSEKNTAERAKFWLRIGAMRAGDLGVICADGMECLDAKTFDRVVESLKGSGLQWFLGRVDEKPFRIERINAE